MSDASRAKPIDPEAAATVVDLANHIGRLRESAVAFQQTFDTGKRGFTRSDRVVCTEVVYRSYEGLGGVHFQMTRRAGRETVSAEDLLNLAIGRQFFEQVAVYCPDHSAQLLVDEEMTSVLRQTMADPVE